MDLKIVKRVNKAVKYTDKKGKEHCSVNYYVVVNNEYIAIRPCFAQGYTKLDVIAEKVVNG